MLQALLTKAGTVKIAYAMRAVFLTGEKKVSSFEFAIFKKQF